MREYQHVPVEVARQISATYKKSIVVVLTWDNKHHLMHTTTFGASEKDKHHAAQLGDVATWAAGCDLSKKQVYEDFREVRPSVRAFARAMEAVLKKNESEKGNQNGANGRPGWRQDPVKALFDHLKEEVEELRVELEEVPDEYSKPESEAIDVANMAMMVWDRTLMLMEATDPN